MRFLLDQDIPEDSARVVRHWGHEATVLGDVLAVTTPDEEAFACACARGLIMITCNRDDILALAAQRQEYPGLIILVRRRTRQAECAAVLRLIQRAGESGLASNVNIA